MGTNQELRNQYIQIGLDNERYAIRMEELHEIIPLQGMTRVPRSKPYLKGITNLRGQIIPVISLRHRFGLPEKEPTKYSRIIIVGWRDEKVGIIVDRVYQVLSFPDIQPPPDRVGNIQSSFFTGVGRVDDRFVGILQLEQVLGTQE